MIIGKGLIATLFLEHDTDEVVYFASGVSNSSETCADAFRREALLVEKTLNENPDKLLVYFSTCSIYDSSKYNSLYVLHKLHMEELIKQKAKDFLILRVSNAVGKGGNANLLMNYLFRQINSHAPLTVHKNATRNLIDVEDVKHITLRYIESQQWNKIVNVAYTENFTILEIIKAFEQQLDKTADKTIENKGEHYSIDVQALDYRFELTEKLDYLNRIITKYYE